VQISLINGSVPGNLMGLAFDDALLVEGDGSSPALNRSQILTNVSLSDPTGLALQTASGSGSDASFIVSTAGYDNFWRQNSQFLPYPAANSAALSEQPSPMTSAKSAWPAAGSTPFTATAFPSSSAIAQTQTASTGDAWALNAGQTAASGTVLMNIVPFTGLQMPENSFETYIQTAAEKPYAMHWIRDQDNNYAVSWTDARGQLQATAKLLDKQGKPTPREWKWAFTTYQYYPNGVLQGVTVPSTSSQVQPTITSYDFQGRVIATSSPDEGLTRYWYDQAGRLRFWRTSTMQDSYGGWAAWRSYDNQGRPIKEGVCRPLPGNNVLQAMAEVPGSEQSYSYVSSSTYTKGWIYDRLDPADFQERTSVALTTVVGATNFAGANGQGRLVAKYNLNPFYNPTKANDPALSTPAAKLVVDLYSYDGYQRPQVLGKYIGGITDQTMRSQSIEYRYDSAGRVANLLVDKNMAQTTLVDGTRAEDANYSYSYDDKGRVYLIQDSALPLANYQYDIYSRLSVVKLGNLHVAPIITALAYHLHGQILGLSTTVNGNASYLEELGYEAPQLNQASTNIVAPTASYDGRITQAVHQFGTDLDIVDPTKAPGTQTIKAVNYTYDPAGRMSVVQTFIPQNNVTYSQSGFASLQVPFDNNTVPNLSASYTYDDDDRLANVKWGSALADTFNYKAGLNQLDNVAGTIEPGSARDASAPATFSYDAAGRLTKDISQFKEITYGYDGLPTDLIFSSVLGPLTTYIYPLYDADGQMASYARALTGPTTQGLVGKYQYIRLGGFNHKEINESWTVWNNYLTASYNNSFVLLNYRGQNATVGRKFPGNSSLQRQFLIKDHQGSTIRLVNEDGTTGGAYDYEAYGDVRTLSGEATNLTQKYTGKEFFPGLGLAYFGARWYDPQLGLWTTPDPMHQHMSPYAASVSPVNSTDPNGLWDDAEVCGDDGSGDWWGGNNWSRNFVDASGNAASYANLMNAKSQFNWASQLNADMQNFNHLANSSGSQNWNSTNSSIAQSANTGDLSNIGSGTNSTGSSLLSNTADAQPFADALQGALYALVPGMAQGLGLPQSAGAQTSVPSGTSVDALEMGSNGGRIPNGDDPMGAVGLVLPAAQAAVHAAGPALSALGGLFRAGEGVGDLSSVYSTAYEMRLDPADFGKSRSVHFNRANAALDAELQANPEFASQMEELIPGVGESVSKAGGRATPSGWVWHHEIESGVMRLVPESQHTPSSLFWNVLHPQWRGGYSIWGIPNGAPSNF
jgi:RHS repeat-associated protein